MILSMMKLGELDVVDDLVQLADDRQREIFERMAATGAYIAPEEFQDHENMIAYSLRYVMSSEFQYLEEDEKKMIRQHIRERGVQANAEKAPAPTSGIPGPMGTPAQVPGAIDPLAGLPAGATEMLSA